MSWRTVPNDTDVPDDTNDTLKGKKMNQTKERCIYCGSNVYYEGTEKLIKCGMCGHTLIVARFENELAKMNAAIEEGEAAKHALEAAEREKKAADDRLFGVLSSFDAMRDLKGFSETSFAEMTKAFDENKDQQEAMMMLLRNVGDGLKEGQNAGLKAIQALASSQKDAAGRLSLMQGLSDRILKSQDDILAKLQMQAEIVTQLQTIQMDASDRQKLMTDFVLWAQTAQDKDYACLRNIESSASVLLRGQKEIADRVGRLQQAADRTQKTLEDFRGQYTQDKLEELRGLYHQAENFQHDQAYEQAEDYYRQVIVKGGGDAEVYWRLILCHYCISYQQDDEGRFIPIILNPDLSDPEEMSVRKDFQPYIEADRSGTYKAELARIDRILDKYRELRDDVHYDIFISVKQSGPDGHPTLDSDKAFDLYYHLTEMGFKVFNSRVCKAELVAAGEYEPYIIAALMSARVLIVLGTNADNMNAQWVKNEWSRFQWLMKKEADQRGLTERILLCYLAGEMRPNEIPKALNRRRQAITEGPTTDQQLARVLNPLRHRQGSRAVAPVVPVPNPKETEPVAYRQPEETPAQVLNQMTVWLFTGHYESVLDKYNKLTQAGRFLDEPQLHIYALCAEKKVEDIEQLVESDLDLGREGLFKLARKFSIGTALADELAEYLGANKAWRKAHQKAAEPSAREKTEQPKEQKVRPVKKQPQTADAWYEAGKEAILKDQREEAFHAYEQAAKLGHAPAMFGVGLMYLAAYGVKYNEDVYNDWMAQVLPMDENLMAGELPWMIAEAERGSAFLAAQLGYMYKWGSGVASDYAEAKKWFKLSAENGSPFGMYRYGMELSFGTPADIDRAAAFSWYQKSADAGYLPAMTQTANLYLQGKGVDKDEHAYYVWNKKAADLDYGPGYVNVGICYEEGRGVKADPSEAVKYYLKGVEMKRPVGMMRLGMCYENGIGVPQSDDEAEKYYRMAMEAFQYPHQKEDIRKRLEALAQKRKQTLQAETPEACYKKGMDFLNGQTVQRNRTEAFKWLMKAAEQGYADAQYEVGNCYRQGICRPKSADKAAEWLKKAAQSGHIKAQFDLGEMYEKGEGVWSIEEAKKYYKMASDRGYAQARNALNRMNSSGGAKASASSVSSADKVMAARKAALSGVGAPEADSWEEIIKNIKNNTYKEKYKIGFAKKLDLGPEGIITMRLVAFDTDQLTFGKNKAATTWIADQALATPRCMNKRHFMSELSRGSKGGWEQCQLRKYLRETLKEMLPGSVKAAVKDVVKYTNGYDENGFSRMDMKTSDNIWIPSGREVGAPGGTLGPSYDRLQKGKNSTRIRTNAGTGKAVWWWLRSSYDNAKSFDRISDAGAASTGPAERESGIVIGFCI